MNKKYIARLTDQERDELAAGGGPGTLYITHDNNYGCCPRNTVRKDERVANWLEDRGLVAPATWVCHPHHKIRGTANISAITL